MDDSVALQNSARVSIDNKNGMIAAIQQNGVGGFGANAVQRQQLSAQLLRRLREHALQRAAVSLIEILNENLQLARFLAEVSGRAHQIFQLPDRDLANSLHAQQTFAAQVNDGFFYIRPCGVLGKIGAYDDLEPRLGRPPVLGTPAGEHSSVVVNDFRLDGYRGHAISAVQSDGTGPTCRRLPGTVDNSIVRLRIGARRVRSGTASSTSRTHSGTPAVRR